MNKGLGFVSAALLGMYALLSSACGSHSYREQQNINISIPGYTQGPREQLEYIVRHYWDSVNLNDSTWLERKEAFEAKFVDYFSLLSDLKSVPHKLLVAPLEHLEGNLLLEALSYYRRYYYEPDSPLADDELYRYVVIWAIQSPKVPTVHQDIAKELLKGLQRNRVGHKATDFVYANDSTGSLRLLPLRQELLLLIFGTSKCHACEAIHNYIHKQPVYARLVKEGKLRVLTVYVQSGEDKSVFAPDSLRPKWHEQGIDVRDSIINNRLYDIKSSPTIYLLGKGGKVLLRDPKPDKLTEYLTHL